MSSNTKWIRLLNRKGIKVVMLDLEGHLRDFLITQKGCMSFITGGNSVLVEEVGLSGLFILIIVKKLYDKKELIKKRGSNAKTYIRRG